MTVIIKMIKDKPLYNKIDPTPEEEESALKLHKSLETLVPKIEKDLEKVEKENRELMIKQCTK